MSDSERRWAAVYAHRERLLRLARARLGSAPDAEDVVQEAMLRAVEFAALDEDRLGQFLTTVTVRLCTDVHRGRQRGDRLARKLTGFWAHDPGPEETVCDRAESAWLSGRLDQLPPKQRAIVEARAEGLSCGAVAERLLVPYTTVESALARVRRSLRVALESSLGVVGVRGWVRLRRVAVAGATASAAALTVGQVAAPPDAVPRLAAPAPGARQAPETAEGGGRAAAAGRARPVAAAPDAATGATATGAGERERRGPGGRDTWGYAKGPLAPEAGVGSKRHDFTMRERVTHCATYGVGVGQTIQCRYPPGHPNNTEEVTGTPPTPEGDLT